MQSPSMIELTWFRIVVLFFCSLIPSLCAQTSSAQTTDSKSWTTTTESHTSDTNPMRTTESHKQSANGTVDSQSIERLGPDGHYEPFYDIEKESVQVNDTTIRTVERTFNRDGSGQRVLTQVTEEEKQSLPAGGEKVVRTTSDADLDGHLRFVQREVADTQRPSPDAQEKKTTVFLSDGMGGMVRSMQILEHEKHNSDRTVEVQKSTLLPDGAGNWQVNERKESTIKEDGKDRTTEEHVLRLGADDKLSLDSRSVVKESQTAAGEKRNTVETYSTYIPGSAPDGNLRLSQRVTEVRQAPFAGAQATEQKLEQPDPGDPGAGLQLTTKTLDVVQPDASGTRETRTIEVRDASGGFTAVSFDTRKSDNVHAVNVDMAPQNKPK
jgi:hypothetical protein